MTERQDRETEYSPEERRPGDEANRPADDDAGPGEDGAVPGAIAGTSLLGPTGGTVGADPGEAIETAVEEPDESWPKPDAGST